MKLTDYIKDLGRAIAYHPNLRKVTGSTTAGILLCQLLYWTDKTRDGWIYKTHYDLEEETGLTYNEQKTARRVLVDLGILEERFMRWDRTNKYRINQQILNDKWEIANGRKTEPSTSAEQLVEEYKQKTFDDLEEETVIPASAPVSLTSYQNPDLHPEHPAHRSDAIKKGDLVQGIIDLSADPGVIRENAKNEIRRKISTTLHVNIDAVKWNKFIDFVYIREKDYNEPVEKFISWTLANNPNSVYWTAEKMIMLYPQAFAESIQNKPIENFVEQLPERKKEEYASMPEELKNKRKLT